VFSYPPRNAVLHLLIAAENLDAAEEGTLGRIEQTASTFGRRSQQPLTVRRFHKCFWGRAIGRVCKPEVAGSNPARSISRNC
jgi:hypothetical protein